MFIENCSLIDAKTGNHYDAGPRGVLIQITDPAFPAPQPAAKFDRIVQFEFLDAEDEDGYPDETKISWEQAESIAQLLLWAKGERRNVIVHCHAGICRSGAVAEVGVMLGFDDAEKFRQPNLRVKRRLIEVLDRANAFA